MTIPRIGQIGSVTPANAGLGDCVDATKLGIELVEQGAELATNTQFLDCAGKITSFDPISIAVGALFTGFGAEGDFSDTVSCQDWIKGEIVGKIVDAIKAAIYQFPAIGQVLDAGFHLVGSSLTDFMNYAGDQLYDMLKTIFSPVFAYIDCGCQVAGAIDKIAAKTAALAEKTGECAATVAGPLGAASEAVGEYVECNIAGHCLVGGVQQEQTAYVYPPCQPGWLIGKYYVFTNTDTGETSKYWTTSDSCTCPDGTSYKSKGGLLAGESEYNMSPVVADRSYLACKCDGSKQGYQSGGVCAKCPKSGLINADGTCPSCDYGEVSANGVCKKCAVDEYIQNGVCMQGPACEDGKVAKFVASTDPYLPGTVNCDQRLCTDGNIFDADSKSCRKCKANEYATYVGKPTLSQFGDFSYSQTLGTCAKCAKGLYSPPGSMKCCPSGMVSDDGIECVPSSNKQGSAKAGGTGIKLDVPNPKLLEDGKPIYDGRSIGVPAEEDKTKKAKGSRCPEGQVMTTDRECRRSKGNRTAPDLVLPSERIGSDPSRVRQRASPQQTLSPGIETPSGSRRPPPPAPSPQTVAPGIQSPTVSRQPPTLAPSLHTIAPGIVGPADPRSQRPKPAQSLDATPGYRAVPVSPMGQPGKP